MIVFDASSIIGAALKENSIPERALFRARAKDTIALSSPVDQEIRTVLHRPKFASAISPLRLARILDLISSRAVFWEPIERVYDCRDVKDNKYLELALAARTEIIVSSDEDLLVLTPWRGVRIMTSAEYLQFTESL